MTLCRAAKGELKDSLEVKMLRGFLLDPSPENQKIVKKCQEVVHKHGTEGIGNFAKTLFSRDELKVQRRLQGLFN
jgi:hypothetical protein